MALPVQACGEGLLSPFSLQTYWEERLGRNLGFSGVGYIGMGEGFNRWLYRVRRQVFDRAVTFLDLDLRQSQVVDVGSGNGFYIEQWIEKGILNLVGTDLTYTSTEYLKHKFPNYPFHQIDIGSPRIEPLEKESFDIVSAFDVLFHIVDDLCYQRAVVNIYNLLKPGGWFLFSENFLHGRTDRWPHQVSRSLGEITECLKRAGFEVIHRMPMFVLMNDPVDSENSLLKSGWNAFSLLIHKINFLGSVFGMILFPLELILTGWMNESPTTEVMICRKPSIRSTVRAGAVERSG